jgi:1,4-alpha-glucan branching enzyme
MSEPDETNIKPPSWKAILALLGWSMPFIIGAAMLYLGREFATHTEVQAAVAPFEQLPDQVRSLTEFRSRQEKAQERSDAKFEVVQQSLATISAQQRATDEKLNRVLDTLERMQRNQP